MMILFQAFKEWRKSLSSPKGNELHTDSFRKPTAAGTNEFLSCIMAPHIWGCKGATWDADKRRERGSDQPGHSFSQSFVFVPTDMSETQVGVYLAKVQSWWVRTASYPSDCLPYSVLPSKRLMCDKQLCPQWIYICTFTILITFKMHNNAPVMEWHAQQSHMLINCKWTGGSGCGNIYLKLERKAGLWFLSNTMMPGLRVQMDVCGMFCCQEVQQNPRRCCS